MVLWVVRVPLFGTPKNQNFYFSPCLSERTRDVANARNCACTHKICYLAFAQTQFERYTPSDNWAPNDKKQIATRML